MPVRFARNRRGLTWRDKAPYAPLPRLLSITAPNATHFVVTLDRPIPATDPNSTWQLRAWHTASEEWVLLVMDRSIATEITVTLNETDDTADYLIGHLLITNSAGAVPLADPTPVTIIHL